MSPRHPGQLNTSHYRLASLKRLINPSDQPPVTIRKTSRHTGQSLHGQRRSTPTQVTGNWIARENVVCLSTWKTSVYSQLVTRPGRLYGLKNKKQRWCLMQFHKVEITCFFCIWCMWVIWGKESHRQAGTWLHKSFLKRSADELNHKILNSYPLRGLLKYIPQIHHIWIFESIWHLL